MQTIYNYALQINCPAEYLAYQLAQTRYYAEMDTRADAIYEKKYKTWGMVDGYWVPHFASPKHKADTNMD